jgi:hypothetical protein
MNKGEIEMKRKKVQKEVWWGVEYVEHGKKIVGVHFRRHKNAAEAKAGFCEG